MTCWYANRFLGRISCSLQHGEPKGNLSVVAIVFKAEVLNG